MLGERAREPQEPRAPIRRRDAPPYQRAAAWEEYKVSGSDAAIQEPLCAHRPLDCLAIARPAARASFDDLWFLAMLG